MIKLLPHTIVKYNDHPVEIVSYPIEGRINIRNVPGDPTTLKVVLISDITKYPRKIKFCVHALVKGALPFPVDMLRYDGCHIANRLGFFEVIIYKVGERLPKFTEKRWLSFGWTIKTVAVYKY